MMAPRIISREDAQKILNEPNVDCPTGLRNRAMMECMYKAGMRCDEVCGLEPRNIGWQAKELRLKNTKGDKPRVVMIPESLVAWLMLWQAEREKSQSLKNSQFFFSTLEGTRVSDRYMRATLKRYAQEAEITSLEPDAFSPHVFRHTYATERLEEGFNIVEVKELLGHGDIKTTQIYLHSRKENVRDKVDMMDKGNELVQVKQAVGGLDKGALRGLIEALQAMEQGYPQSPRAGD